MESMLFLHKNIGVNFLYSVNSEVRPKTNENDYEHVTEKNVHEVWGKAQKVIRALDLHRYETHIREYFVKWYRTSPHDSQHISIYKMMSSEGLIERKKLGINADWRYYNNYIDLVLALYGEYCASNKLTIENALSIEILKSQHIRRLMQSLTEKLNRHAEIKLNEPNRDYLLRGKYDGLREVEVSSWVQWKIKYSDFYPDVLLPFLYNITHHLGKGWKEKPMNNGKITKQNMRVNVSTPEEDSDWTANARWHNMPIWAAPSYTTQQMLTVAREAEADLDEILAFALTISAFWGVKYPHTATPIHRMLGVMTAAVEFNIPADYGKPQTMYNMARRFIATGNLYFSRL